MPIPDHGDDRAEVRQAVAHIEHLLQLLGVGHDQRADLGMLEDEPDIGLGGGRKWFGSVGGEEESDRSSNEKRSDKEKVFHDPNGRLLQVLGEKRVTGLQADVEEWLSA